MLRISRLRLHCRVLCISIACLTLPTVASAADQERILYRFTGGYDGGTPYAGLVFDSAGNIYGTTSYGGTGVWYGTVFELTFQKSTWTEQVLYSFQGGKDGMSPEAGVTLDSSGNLYGTTVTGGDFGYGTIFELSLKNRKWQKSTLYSFQGNSKSDGDSPLAGVILDNQGNLYGTTQLGGPPSRVCPSGCGTVYELTHSAQGWSETILYAFKGQKGDGAGPSSGLLLASPGHLFGTTSQGGTNGYGVAYKLVSNGSAWKESVIHAFGDSGDGQTPYAGLIMDASGNLYGSTYYGGANGSGSVFQLHYSQGSWIETVLSSSPSFPTGNLLLDSDGNLYGTETAVGCCGAVYELSPSDGQWTFNELYAFTGQPNKDGSMPNGPLVFNTQGDLFGTTFEGGYGPCEGGLGCGVIFKLDPDTVRGIKTGF
jgi:uncharacterized repeat protein (TIGR03803 family)